MKIVRLTISNFRGIKNAELHFDGHTLLVGQNNIGKSTICEALDLVLGPDRVNRFPPVEEFDFYNARYLGEPATEGAPPSIIPIRIEAIVTGLSKEIENRCGGHTEYWSPAEKRVLAEGEADQANPPNILTCLRLETIANYNIEDDEFEASTFFSHPVATLPKLPKRRPAISCLRPPWAAPKSNQPQAGEEEARRRGPMKRRASSVSTIASSAWTNCVIRMDDRGGLYIDFE